MKNIYLSQIYKLFTLHDKTKIRDKITQRLSGNQTNFPNENYNYQLKIKDPGRFCPGLFNPYVSSIVYEKKFKILF